MKRIGWAILIGLLCSVAALSGEEFGDEPPAEQPAAQVPEQPLDAILPAPVPGPEEQVPGTHDEPESASDRPLTNLDAPIADPSGSSAHQPFLPSAQPHAYPLPSRRTEEARAALQRKAEFKADQRNRRIATMKWFGYSNVRPNASAMPFMGTYSPTWVGNGGLPSYWSGVQGWSSTTRVEDYDARR